MAWHDQFQVEDEKVSGRWLALAFVVVVLAVAGYYYLHDSANTHALSDLQRFLAVGGDA
jgi:hypothetical protein